ncbi:MAG: helix-turn-helix transcriptional regulator [Euryarchaeota archaeon]|nr:helix-turn-helix transcriptional regulator [Euryarchaeota archaeon]
MSKPMTKRDAKQDDPMAFDQPLTLSVQGKSAEDLMVPISQLVAAQPDGMATTDLADHLGVSPPTVQKALERLERERHVYSRTVGKTHVWYPNGRLIHPYLQLRKEANGRIYLFVAREGRAGPLIQIVEKSFSLLSGEKTEGSIFVEEAALDDFAKGLEELQARLKTHRAQVGR